MRSKNFEGKPERKNPKRIISASGGIGRLQMVSESNIRRCTNEEVEPWRG